MFRPTEIDAHQDFVPKPFRFRAPMLVDGKWVIRPENVKRNRAQRVVDKWQRRKEETAPAKPIVPEIDQIDALLAEHALFDRLLKKSRKKKYP